MTLFQFGRNNFELLVIYDSKYVGNINYNFENVKVLQGPVSFFQHLYFSVSCQIEKIFFLNIYFFNNSLVKSWNCEHAVT